MNLKWQEQQRDLFTVPEKYYLAHCISADYALGGGIAVEFVRRFDMRKKLQKKGDGSWPDCILIDRTLNLVTKPTVYDQPTYNDLREALKIMRELIELKGIKHLAMPKIGCGIDGLSWDRVRPMILHVFSDLEIEILVCFREEK